MDINEIWKEVTSKPKWYAGIKSNLGSFYSAQTAYLVKRRFERGVLSEEILERILNEHGYFLEKRWVKRP